jgi:hypothetical protein
MNRFDQELKGAAERLAREPLPDGVLDESLDGLTRDRKPWRGIIQLAGVAVVAVLAASIGLGQLMAALGPASSPGPSPEWTPLLSPTPATTATPSPEPPLADPGPVAASVEEDGIGVTLEVDRGRAAFGDRVWALVTIENRGDDNILWGHSSTCDHAAGVAAYPEQPDPLEYGRSDWQGDAEILKRISVHVPNAEWGYTFTPEAWLDPDSGRGCTTDFVSVEVPPGTTLTYRGAWDIVGPHCMPATPGAYSIQAIFTYVGRANRGPAAAGEFLHISVDVPFQVQGPRVPYLSPWEAIDAALSNNDFDTQLGTLPLERWVGADLQFLGGDWILQLNVEAPGQALVAEIDAVSGLVMNVSLISRTGPYSPRTQC